MFENWDILLARYQKQRGGWFFCQDTGAWSRSDSQLVLAAGEKTPLLVFFHVDVSGRTVYTSLAARTTVHLDGEYKLFIRPKNLVGSGFQAVMHFAGENRSYGAPQALKGRMVTTNRKDVTKLVLGDLALRNALTQRTTEYLRVGPTPLEDGSHTIEVGVTGLDGTLTAPNSHWVTPAIQLVDTTSSSDSGWEAVLARADRDFAAQMDGFLDFLRAARDAVTRWPVSQP